MKKTYWYILITILVVCMIISSFIKLVRVMNEPDKNSAQREQQFQEQLNKLVSRIETDKTQKEYVKTYKDSGAYNANGEKHGKWTTYHQHNGKVYTTGSYDDGKKEGEWKHNSMHDYHISTEIYKNGKLVKEIMYHENGQIFTIADVYNDKYVGTQKRFTYDGTLQYIIQYKDTLENGDFTAYYPNGAIEAKGKIVEGWEDGDFTYYDENGEITSIINFKNGDQTTVFEREE